MDLLPSRLSLSQNANVAAYFLVKAPRTLRPEVERFAEWLVTEARATEAGAPD